MTINEKETKIKIKSELYEVEASLFSEVSRGAMEFFDEDFEEELDIIEINAEGTVCDDGERVSITYDEVSEDDGLGSCCTTVTFLKSSPNVVSMVRSGAVSTTLVFENAKRYHCTYRTPFMPFEVCVFTKKVDNRLLTENMLYLDYIVEIRGAKAERTRFSMKLI